LGRYILGKVRRDSDVASKEIKLGQLNERLLCQFEAVWGFHCLVGVAIAVIDSAALTRPPHYLAEGF